MTRFLTFSAVITLLVMHGKVAQAQEPTPLMQDIVTVQTASDVFDGRNYLYVEAENYSTLNSADGTPEDGWTKVSKENPIDTDCEPADPCFGRRILSDGSDPNHPESNVSGQALLDLPGDQYGHDDSATWRVQFATPGIYHFIPRISVYEDPSTPQGYGNEDGIFLAPDWGLNSALDWVGFEKNHFNGGHPDTDPFTEDGFPLDPGGWHVDPLDLNSDLYTEIGDSIHDGRYDILDWGIKNAGVLEDGVTDPSPNDLWDGNFVWSTNPRTGNYDSFNTWLDGNGFRATYEVTPEQVGQELTFEIGTRETYTVLDGFLFIEDPDDSTDILDFYTQEELTLGVSCTVRGDCPDVMPLPGDFDDSGAVGNGDLTLLLDGWGGAPGAGWVNDVPTSVGNDSLTILLDNWGQSLLLGGVSVPEPTSMAIALLVTTSGLTLRRRSW